MPYFSFMASKNSADFTGLPPPNCGHPIAPERYRTVILVTLLFFAPCNLFHKLVIGSAFFCEPEHRTVCVDRHDSDRKNMLYYIIVQCLNRLGLAGEDVSSRRYVGNLMIRKNAIVFLIMLTVLSAGMVFAGDIYKWTDEGGNVHYGDRPTSEVSEEPLAVSSVITDPPKVQARYEVNAAANEPAEPTPEELRAQAVDREEKCATSKARLQKFLTSRRLYKQDENGERVYLDEDEILAARERVQNQVEEYCNF